METHWGKSPFSWLKLSKCIFEVIDYGYLHQADNYRVFSKDFYFLLSKTILRKYPIQEER